MKTEKPYFFTIDDQPFSPCSYVVVTKIHNVSYNDISLLLSMLDANISCEIFTVQYSPKNLELLIYAKEPVSLFGWNHKEEIKKFFSGFYQNDFAYSFDEIAYVIKTTQENFSNAIIDKEEEYEVFLKQKSPSTSILFIHPGKNQNLIIATGKSDGTAEKKNYSFPQISKDPILLQLWQLYCLKKNYEILQIRKTNYSHIALGIESNEFFFEVSLHNKTWRIFEKDLSEWISQEEYQKFISTLKVYPLSGSNWLDDALLLKSSNQKKRRILN